MFVWLPTGYRKSLCYQLLPFIFDFKLRRTEAIATERSIALVISPLVSLMMDQVCSLQARGICAAILSGNTGVNKALLATERDITQGKLRLLFTAPGHCWQQQKETNASGATSLPPESCSHS